MPFALTIEVPEHIKLEKAPRPILVKFKTKEEFEVYKATEARFTRDALRKLAAAFTPAERSAAWLNLFNDRKKFYDLTQKKIEIAPVDAA